MYFIPLSLAEKFESLADERGVSKVARGKVRSRISNGGFFQAAKRANGSVKKLSEMPIKFGSDQTWWQRRNAFCKRHAAQEREHGEPKLEASGRYKGLPTRRELGMIMWMCSSIPPSKLRSIARQL